jgi:hypothetical protein
MSNQPEEVQFYINYAKETLTPYHWNYAPDGSDFLKNALFDIARHYPPLLYALTCFAAYHYSLNRPDGRIEGLLKWHSQSVQALSKSLMNDPKHTVATLLTILQLATIEVSSERHRCGVVWD